VAFIGKPFQYFDMFDFIIIINLQYFFISILAGYVAKCFYEET